MQELLYTSAPRGLRPGSQGFCTVAMTAGLPQALAARLESLSGYRPVYPAGHADAGANPVAFAHWRLTAGGSTGSVLSRIAFTGLDYTSRANKLAHHVVLGPLELPAGGPAWMMLDDGLMATEWSGEPRVLPPGRPIPIGDGAPPPCSAWTDLTGDPGWAGVLAQSFLANPERPAYLVYRPGMQMLPLIDQAIRLLPIDQRWRVTFNTYFTDLPSGLSCAWRCCSLGAPEPPRMDDALVLDLTRPMGAAPDGPYAHYARTGDPPPPEPAPAPVTLSRPGLLHLAATISPAPAPAATPVQQTPVQAPAVARYLQAMPSLPARSRMPVAFWITAVAWPVLVAAGLWFMWMHQQSPAAPATSPEADAWRVERAQAEKKYAAANDLADKLQRDNERLRRAATTPATHPASATDAQEQEHLRQLLAERDRQIAALAADLAAARPHTIIAAIPPVVPATIPAAQPPKTPSEHRVTVAFPDIPADPLAGDPAPAKLGADAIKWAGDPPRTLLLLLPINTPELSVLPEVSGCTLQLKSKNNLGGDKTNDLLSLRFQDGGIAWIWREYPRLFQADKSRVLALERVLRNSAIQLGDGADYRLLQFRRISEHEFHLDTSEVQLEDLAADLRSAAAFGPAIGVRRVPAGWEAVPDLDGRFITLRQTIRPGATFAIALNVATGTMTSNWRTARFEAERDERRAHDERLTLEKLLPKKTDAEIARLGEEAGRQYKLLRDRREEESRQRALKEALDNLGPIELDLGLPHSRVVFYRISVSR